MFTFCCVWQRWKKIVVKQRIKHWHFHPFLLTWMFYHLTHLESHNSWLQEPTGDMYSCLFHCCWQLVTFVFCCFFFFVGCQILLCLQTPPPIRWQRWGVMHSFLWQSKLITACGRAKHSCSPWFESSLLMSLWFIHNSQVILFVGLVRIHIMQILFLWSCQPGSPDASVEVWSRM